MIERWEGKDGRRRPVAAVSGETAQTGEPAPQRQHNEDRMRRAYTWLERSEKRGTEDIERFVFLWIAFNAAYGDESALREFVEGEEARKTESRRFKNFLENIVEQDEAGVLERIVWDEFPGPIRVLLSNRYVYRPFWLAVWGSDRGGDWRRRLDGSKRIALAALSRRDASTVLAIVFDRLYTLRNQIFHGGTTHPSGFGRDQIRDGSRIMASLVPAILDIMRQEIDSNPDSELWGKVAFPRVEAESK